MLLVVDDDVDEVVGDDVLLVVDDVVDEVVEDEVLLVVDDVVDDLKICSSCIGTLHFFPVKHVWKFFHEIP